MKLFITSSFNILKNILKKFIIVIGVLFVIRLALESLFPIVEFTDMLLEQYEPAPNTLFVGSSRLHTGIDPAIIDSINTQDCIRSYNYALIDYTMPNTSDWVKESLTNYPEVNTVIFEISGYYRGHRHRSEWWKFILSRFISGDAEWNLVTHSFNTVKLPVVEWLAAKDNIDFYRSGSKKLFRDRLQKISQRQKLIVREERLVIYCLLYTSPSPRDLSTSRMPSSA